MLICKSGALRAAEPNLATAESGAEAAGDFVDALGEIHTYSRVSV